MSKPAHNIKSISILGHLLSRPKMYFGDTPTASVELAAFLNGWMTHRSGFMRNGFMCNSSFGCQSDPNKTLEENAKTFKTAIEEWDRNKSGTWRCCVDAPLGEQ